MVEQGLVFILIACLKDKVMVGKVLETIAYLLEKMRPKRHSIDLYERFYNCDILEYLMYNLNEGEVSTECVFIIYSYS